MEQLSAVQLHPRRLPGQRSDPPQAHDQPPQRQLQALEHGIFLAFNHTQRMRMLNLNVEIKSKLKPAVKPGSGLIKIS